MSDEAQEEKPERKKGKDTLLLEAKDRQIAALEKRAEKSDDSADDAKDETIAAWKWTGLAWRNMFIGAHAVYAIIAVLVLGVNYLDLDVPYIGHLKRSRDSTSAGEKAAEASNAMGETLDVTE